MSFVTTIFYLLRSKITTPGSKFWSYGDIVGIKWVVLHKCEVVECVSLMWWVGVAVVSGPNDC